MTGSLFIVATPIGNLDDLSPRARRTLADVDVIAAEDTRHTRRLLSHFGIKKPLLAFHDRNEQDAVPGLIERLESGESVALVSDAGTPLISDPGYRLVRDAAAAGIAARPVPGPSAVTAALSVAGLPTDRFCFEGFLPARVKARRERLLELRHEPRTLVFYESVHRVVACLADLADVLGSDRPAFLGRELTKLHEQCVHATLADLGAELEDGTIPSKGEIVIVVAGGEPAPRVAIDIDALLLELAAVLPARAAAGITARVSGGRRNALYRRLIELENRDTGD